jgi:predicted PurR-regulated permease PerM
VSNRWAFRRNRAAWWAVGSLLALSLLFVLWSFVGTFIFGVFVYYSTRPVYRRIQDYIYPPSLAAGVALFLLGLPVILLFSYTLAVSLQEFSALLERLGSDGPIADMLAPYINVSSVVQNPQEILESESLRPLLESLANEAPKYLGFITNGALHVFLMIAIAFYLLRDDQRLSRWFRGRFADEEGLLEEYVQKIDRDFSNIFFGNILNAFLTGIIGAVTYNLLDFFGPVALAIPYPTLLGLLAGVASLIPVIGMKLVYFPVTAFLYFEAWSADPALFWFPTVFLVLSLVVVDTIPDFVLRPYVSGRGLHIGMVMFAYIIGPLLFGWPGIFLGPVLLVLIIHFVEIVLPELVPGAPTRPQMAVSASGPADQPQTGGEENLADSENGEEESVTSDATTADEDSSD